MPEPGEGIAHVDSPLVSDCEPLPREPMAALEKLTQLNGESAIRGANACGAVSLVAATIATRGYAGLRRLAESLREELSDETHGELARLAEVVASGGEEATYGALAAYADRIHRRYRGFDGGMPFENLQRLMKGAGFRQPRVINDDAIHGTINAPGQCWPAKIVIDGGPGEGDHWILVGRDARGNLFLYDPYPREDGSQVIRQGERDWKKYAAAIAQDEDGTNTIGFLPRE